MATATFTRMPAETQIVELIERQDFKVNGVSAMRCIDSDQLLHQAHAVLSFITGTAVAANGFNKLDVNQDIALESLNAVETLLGMALWHRELERAVEH